MMPRSTQLGTSDPRLAAEEAVMDVAPDLREAEAEGYGESNTTILYALSNPAPTNLSRSLFDSNVISYMDILVLCATRS